MNMRWQNYPTRRGRWWVSLGLWLPGVVAGCNLPGVDRCADIPKGAIPVENGTHLREIMDVQAAKAEADDFVIYKYEWCTEDGKVLGPYGNYHLGQMIRRLPAVPFPVLIQVHPDESVNEARRIFIVQQLAAAGIPDPDQRVLVGFPAAEGLYGEEAENIYRRMIQESASSNRNQFGGAFGRGFGSLGGVGGFGGGFGGFGGGFGGFGGGFVPGF
jgi:hypothetical protein